MKFKEFGTSTGMMREMYRLLREHMRQNAPSPRAVMLSGGRTPQPLYDDIRRRPFPASPTFHILLSDERMVPKDSPESNLGQMRPMIAALNIPPERLLGVNTSLPLVDAANRYERDIQAFLDRNGRIALALLGLGADGHTASLFGPEDLAAAKGRLAIPVKRRPPPDRVTATPSLIARSDRVVFLVSGTGKADIVTRILSSPESVVAAQATRDAPSVELWFSKE